MAAHLEDAKLGPHGRWLWSSARAREPLRHTSPAAPCLFLAQSPEYAHTVLDVSMPANPGRTTASAGGLARLMKPRPTDHLLTSQFGRDRHLRMPDGAQVEAAWALSVVVRWGPVRTAVNGTLVARPVRRSWYPVAPLVPP
jgi:hypothetical protein